MTKVAATVNTLNRIASTTTFTTFCAPRLSLSLFNSAYRVLCPGYISLILAAGPLLSLAQNPSEPAIQNTANAIDFLMRNDMHIDPAIFGLSFQIAPGNYPGRGGSSLPVTLNYS
jgi:hypothetical protein